MSPGPDLSFDQVVFSGGGLRCFWQGGFLEGVEEAMGKLSPARVTGVSGGALAGAAWLSGQQRRLLDEMQAAFRGQDGNFPWHRQSDEGGPTPHQRLYREVVESVLDRAAQDRVAEGPRLQVLLARPPGGRVARSAASLAGLVYKFEQHLKGDPRTAWPEAMGVETFLADANEAARQGKLADLVCCAATIPPVFELAKWEECEVIDAGMADQAPMPDPDKGRTLILLTRHFARLPQAPGRVFVEPSDPIPADKIDFTDPQALFDAWSLGCDDAALFLKQGPATGADE